MSLQCNPTQYRGIMGYMVQLTHPRILVLSVVNRFFTIDHGFRQS